MVKKVTHAGGRNWWKGGYPPWAQWGNYSHQRGILNFGLSAYALNPWAGTIKYGVPRTLARIRRNIIYWAVPTVICTMAVMYVKDLHEKSLRKAFHAHEEHEVLGTGSSIARQELGPGKRAKQNEF